MSGKTFREWCNERTCDKCPYESMTTWRDCQEAFEKDRERNVFDLERLERKIDAIMKHFNVKI